MKEVIYESYNKRKSTDTSQKFPRKADEKRLKVIEHEASSLTEKNDKLQS
jgi:hypothetical protein